MNAPKKADAKEKAPIRYDDPLPAVASNFPTSPAPSVNPGGAPFEGEPSFATVGIAARVNEGYGLAAERATA